MLQRAACPRRDIGLGFKFGELLALGFTLNPEPSTLNPKHSTLNPKPYKSL